jgi:hypothetical protein
MKCKCCNRELSLNDLRMDFCFDCVESESVIVEGVDMYDKEVPLVEGLTKGLSKLQYILKKYNKTLNT